MVANENIYTFPYDDSQHQPGPFVFLKIRDKARGFEIGKFPAVIDTGSTITCIPESYTKGLPEEAFSFTNDVKYGDSVLPNKEKILNLPSAEVDFIDKHGKLILTRTYRKLSFLVGRKGLVEKEGQLGLDILNEHVCKLDGPSLRYIIEKTWP